MAFEAIATVALTRLLMLSAFSWAIWRAVKMIRTKPLRLSVFAGGLMLFVAAYAYFQFDTGTAIEAVVLTVLIDVVVSIGLLIFVAIRTEPAHNSRGS